MLLPKLKASKILIKRAIRENQKPCENQELLECPEFFALLLGLEHRL